MSSMKMEEDEEKVTLSGQNHLKSLCDGLWKFFNESALVDLTVTCHGHLVKVHRLILALFSPILRESILTTGEGGTPSKDESQQQDPHALNLDYVTSKGNYLEYLIEFLYQGKVTLPKTCLNDLLQTAEVLAVQELIDAIRDFNLGGSASQKHPKMESDIEQQQRFVDGTLDSKSGGPGSSKRKRKRKPMKVTKVFDDEDVCMTRVRVTGNSKSLKAYSDNNSPGTGSYLGKITAEDTPRITRSSSQRVHQTPTTDRSASVGTDRDSQSPDNSSGVDMDCEPIPKDFDNDDDDFTQDDDESNWQKPKLEPLDDDDDDDEEDGEGEDDDDDYEDDDDDNEIGKKRSGRTSAASKLEIIAESKQRRRRQPRTSMRRSRKDNDSVSSDKQLSTKEYRKKWRQTRPVMKCKYCAYETRDKTSLRSHQARHDPTAERFVCQVCSKSFRSKKGIRCHLLSHSGPDRLHKCTHCEFHTPQKWNWLQHLAVIHKVDPLGNPLEENIKCEQCDFVCVANHQLKAHMLRKHTVDKPFKCQQCDYQTVIKHELEKHIGIRHHNERRYMCESCGFRSQTQGGLTRHKRSHTGVKPFKCDLCGMCYADRGKLKIHLIRHTSDEKPFVCHICGHACRRRDNLRMHLKRIHGANLETEAGTQGNHRIHFPMVEHHLIHQDEQLQQIQQLLQQRQEADEEHPQPETVAEEHLVTLHENCLAVVRDDSCSLLQVVSGALNCANSSNHLHVIQENQCIVLQTSDNSEATDLH